MRIPVVDQEKVFTSFWEPMQLRLGEHLSDFVRHYLMKQGTVVKQGEIYRTLKDRTDDQSPNQISGYLEGMHRSAIHYHRLLDPSQELNPDLGKRLRRFQRMDVGVSWPFLLNLYTDYEAGSLTLADFCSVLDVFENFFIRRFICAVPTHGLNKILPPLYYQALKSVSLLQGVRELLSQRDYPTDAVFRQALINVRLYGLGERLPKAKLVLESLESALAGKEQVTTEPLSIEHIMPQTLSAWWQQHIGESSNEVYETRLHSLGNLTLTGYNAELSNNDFTSKLELFRRSPIQITRSICQFARWDDLSIQRRGEDLADLALKVWPYFGPDAAQSADAVISGYTGRTPSAVTVLDRRRNVTTWRDVLQVTIEAVRENSPDMLDEIILKFPKLLSRTPEKLRTPRETGDGLLYFESNQSANSTVRYCQQVTESAGYSLSDWSVETLL
jgi:hypothetical protein